MWCHCMASVSQVSLSWRGSWDVARCHCHCTAPGVAHTVTMTALSHSCRAVLPCTAPLLLPGVSQGVTVSAQRTGCHCHRGAAGCHAASLQLPWVVIQSHHQCPVHGMSPSAMSLHGPRGVTRCHRHCRPAVYHPVSLSLHGLGCHGPSPCRIPRSACPMGCHPAPACILGCVTPHPHRPRDTLGTAQQLPAAQVPTTQYPPGGNSSPSPSPLPTHSHGRLQLPGEQPFPITHQPGSN